MNDESKVEFVFGKNEDGFETLWFTYENKEYKMFQQRLEEDGRATSEAEIEGIHGVIRHMDNGSELWITAKIADNFQHFGANEYKKAIVWLFDNQPEGV